MKKHNRLVETAKKSVDAVFGDASVSALETLVSLKDVRDHLDVLISSVASDVEMVEDE